MRTPQILKRTVGWAVAVPSLANIALTFYNEERFHQALGNDTPSKVYHTGIGGGAMILEKYGIAGEAPSVSLRSTDGASPEEATTEATAPAPATTTAIPSATPETGQRRAAACETSTA